MGVRVGGWGVRRRGKFGRTKSASARRTYEGAVLIYERSTLAIVVFLAFVAVTLGLSTYLGKKAKSSAGYFAAHGQIPWFVNGVAFAGDYLSAASFLGICGMIAFYGYDGFLYSIGYLAGWVVALFVVAEPMKRLGKFTFADALNSRFNSPGIKLAAGVSTLVVSVFYLIPQMVGAGVLVQPLLGLPHWVGVVLVGAVVIFIVVTAGMVSTTCAIHQGLAVDRVQHAAHSADSEPGVSR
jgi:cation/acetate symporter